MPARCSRGHVGKFAIAYHTWVNPFKRIVAASRGKPYRLLLPLIGEPVALPIASDGESLPLVGGRTVTRLPLMGEKGPGISLD